MSDVATPAAIVEFWFGHADPSAAPTTPASRWWTSDPAFDAEIADRFTPTMDAARTGQLDSWAERPLSALALVLVCDQFPRNVFRGSAEAFAWDARARRVARHLEDRGWPKDWHLQVAAFALLPFEHSEDIADQEHSCSAFERLIERQPESLKAEAQHLHSYAVRHRDIIARFGRFPHRNAALGRVSTPEEQAYLTGGGDRFGQ
jgi:uncharacterized protein (DUF924 family)